MKRCLQCFETYADSENFCELDGQRLIADISTSAAVSSSQQKEIWLVGTAGVVLGVVVCVGAYLAYGFWNEDSGFKETTAPALASQAQAPIKASQPQTPRPEKTTPPEEETAVAEPEPTAEPAAPAVEETQAATAKLNQGPVSTGQRKKDDEDSSVQTVIQMNDGTAVEVDAAWEDGQGVWYRRGGMVAFVESQRVKSINGRAAHKPSPVSQ